MKRKYETRVTPQDALRRSHERRATSDECVGSALILAVVLTSLLAIIGTVFLMVARVDKIATSAITENKELQFALESVVAEISQQLALDVLDMSDPNRDYYDYPIHRLDPGPDGITGTADDALFDPGLDGTYGTADDSPTYPGPDGIYGTVDDIPVTGVLDDYWLANLEPEIVDVGGDMGLPPDMDFGFRHITDLYGRLAYLFQDSFNYFLNSIEYTDLDGDRISFRNMRVKIIASALPIQNEGDKADADGDGVADSRWIKLPNITTNKNKPIFAAVRLIDNGGMLNVNTAYKFDPTELIGRIDGSSQMQINLAALSQRGANGTLNVAANNLQAVRCGSIPPDIFAYEQNVIWRYGKPLGAYTPFDISEELELKNRFLVRQVDTSTRIKELWTKTYRWGLYAPRTKPPHSDSDPNDWFWYANNSSLDINDYDYRHISTTYNMDRIINPVGPTLNFGKMLNVNRIDPNNNADPNIFDLYNFIRLGFADANFFDDSIAAQLAVNIKDFRDSDVDISSLMDSGGLMHYGFEQPCVYISELAHRFVLEPQSKVLHRSYAIELYKPYESDDYPTGQWQLEIESYPDSPIQIDWSGNERFHVILFEDPCDPCAPINVVWEYDPNFAPACQPILLGPGAVVFDPLTKIELQRFVVSDSNWVTVDSVNVPAPLIGSWWEMDANTHSFQRDITPHKCIRRLWDEAFIKDSNTLGRVNQFIDGSTDKIQAHPENQPFTGIGEIGKVFRKAVYSSNLGVYPPDIIGYNNDTEDDVRLDLTVPAYQHIFNYLTVMDPADHIPDPTETRIKGRININTAPWFVIAQLPWVSYHTPNYELAKAIVAYRDRTATPAGPDYSGRPGEPGFENIGQLNNVNFVFTADPNYGIDYYSRDFVDQFGFPDLTFDPITFLDGAPDDFEERDLIFSRISNLVTVRSDVFTAYILVRIGVDGPQKRAIAVLDRSQVNDISGKVKVIALHPVPDPR